MKNPRFLFWLIIVLTVLAILIDLPKEIVLSYDSPKLPFINKSISIHKTIAGFSPNFMIGSTRIYREFVFQKGLDLEGGISLTYKAEMQGVDAMQNKEALDGAKDIIERRINFFGVSEPVVQTATVNNQSRILVEMPGVSDANQAIALIGKTAQLTFWEEGVGTPAAVIDESTLPVGLTQFLGPNPKKTNLTGKDLQQAGVSFDTNTGGAQVTLAFSGEGAKKFSEITQRNINKSVAIVLDDQLVSAPTVNTPITDGNAVITGGFTTDQAKGLSIQLNSGALPVSLTLLEQRVIGPTLGEESLQKSLFAGMLGFIVIVVFMIVMYGRFGVLASFALLLYTLFVLALFKIIPITLTLAGIAGFILSIGMAVDANILIFERMKEELRSGKKLPLAIELGFSRAWTSIRDSNISSLITSFILYYFGTGPVRGFAVTLALGVLVSMFSAIVVTRTFLRLIYKENTKF